MRDGGGNHGGGVMVFVKKNLNVSNVFSCKDSEIISFNINIANKNISVLSCYRPPYKDNETQFLASVDSILNSNTDSSETVIMGDLNFNMCDQYHCAKLAEFNAINGFTNTVFKSTRIDPRNGNESLLDVILTDSYSSLVSSNVFNYPNSVHKLTISTFNHRSSQNKQCSINSRNCDISTGLDM